MNIIPKLPHIFSLFYGDGEGHGSISQSFSPLFNNLYHKNNSKLPKKIKVLHSIIFASKHNFYRKIKPMSTDVDLQSNHLKNINNLSLKQYFWF